MPQIVGTAFLLAVIAGFLAGGRVLRLGDVRLSAGFLAFTALAIMVLESVADFGDPTDRILVAMGYALAAAFLVVNIARSSGALRLGLAVLALGWVLNAAVMVSNGGMPLSLDAYAASGQTEAPTPGTGGFFKIVLADESTVLRSLGDVIPIRPFRQVVSAGDLVLMAGLVLTVAAGMRGTRSERAPATPPRRRLAAA